MNKILSIFIILYLCTCAISCQDKGKTEKGIKSNSNTIALPSHSGGETSSGSSDGNDSESPLTSKGTIISEHDIPVYSMVSEVIKEKFVKEGMRVSKGQVMFILDQTMHQSEIEKTRREIDQAKFQYQSILVGQGYDMEQPENIPAKIKSIARTRSSLNLYEQELKQQALVTTYYTIHAPESGVITDVQAYQHDLAEKGKELCHIVDTEHLQVIFSILENEISSFEKGTTIHFSTIAYPNLTYSATVTQVSPKVDENGMVKIKANVIHESHFSDLKVGMTTIVKK